MLPIAVTRYSSKFLSGDITMKSTTFVRYTLMTLILLGTASAGSFLIHNTTPAGAETYDGQDGASRNTESLDYLVTRIAALESRLTAAEAELSILRGRQAASYDNDLLTLAQLRSPATITNPPSGGPVIVPPGGAVIPQPPVPGSRPDLRITPPSRGQDGPTPQATPGQATGRPDGIAVPGFDSFMRIVLHSINGLAGPHLIIEGVNVHIRSGSGRTGDSREATGNIEAPRPVGPNSGTFDENGALTGLGNLVVGYNEPPDFLGAGDRTGSHNIIVGEQHIYSSFGGFVAGVKNTIIGRHASVGGGALNIASGIAASVSGGSRYIANDLGSHEPR